MRDSAGGTELVICTATTAARPAGAALREDMNRVLVVQRDGPYLGGGGEADLERGAAGVGGVPSRTGSKRGGSGEGHQDKGRFPPSVPLRSPLRPSWCGPRKSMHTMGVLTLNGYIPLRFSNPV